MCGVQEIKKCESVQSVNPLIGIEKKSRKIPLTQNKASLVDEEDYERLSKYKWFAHKGRYTYYAVRHLPCKEGHHLVRMHREVLGLMKGDGIICDHKNGNGLDNRQDNLRRASYCLNKYNTQIYKNNTSGFRGVYFMKDREKWAVQIGKDGKLIYCGSYKSKEEAAIVYDKMAIKYYGDDAILNFSLGGLKNENG
jgi:hypothetical protein